MWESLRQLNSKPVVVLEKLKCIEDELKKPYAKCMISETARHKSKGNIQLKLSTNQKLNILNLPNHSP